jgi:phosphatidylglycerophosphate synthase
MTRRARLTTPAAGDPFARVAGMSVLLRQLLSLQDAGIEEVLVEGLSLEQLPQDPRLTLRLSPLPPASSPPRGEGELSARLGLVWHRLLPKRLVQSGYTGDIEAAKREGDEFVIAAADAASRRVAEDRLFSALLKATDGLISRSINRRISLPITRLLINTSLTPNQMTLIAAIFGVAAIWVVLAGGASWLVPGALLLQAQSILDGCDGEISRLKYIRSRLGEWLDQVVDDTVNVGFFAATGWALYQAGWALALPITIVGAACHVIYQAALYIGLITRGGGSGSVASIRWSGQLDPDAPNGDQSPRSLFKIVKETLEMTGRRDFFTFLYLPTALLHHAEIALCWCALIFFLSGTLSSLLWLLHGGPRPAPRSS